jgi:hypothetical protein
MSRALGFAPIENAAAIVLILGSLPGKASLAAVFQHHAYILQRSRGGTVFPAVRTIIAQIIRAAMSAIALYKPGQCGGTPYGEKLNAWQAVKK